MCTYPSTNLSPPKGHKGVFFFSLMFHKEINENMNQSCLMNDVLFVASKTETS